MSGEDAAYQWISEDTGLTSWSDQLVGALACPQLRLSENILTPKEVGRFILDILTNRIQKAYLRILIGLCLVFNILCKMKPVDQC